ncbi:MULTISPECIES: hypothetical protein [Streptomyces]|uniref:hypothetical protein n=1 Tax=Streptomyces TaxID=1883 RepID=UPI00117C4187|nr:MULTISPECIES: hypothetical protein [Streptomyces]
MPQRSAPPAPALTPPELQAMGGRIRQAAVRTAGLLRIRDVLGGKVRHVICGRSPLGRRLAAF